MGLPRSLAAGASVAEPSTVTAFRGRDRRSGHAPPVVPVSRDHAQPEEFVAGALDAFPDNAGAWRQGSVAPTSTQDRRMYTRHGFTRVRKVAKWRWVMRTKI